MKKTSLLNSELSSVISQMGHTDSLVIADCGLPIYDGVKRIDLALTHNVPTFIDTLDVILSELCVEEVIIAKEMLSKSKTLYDALIDKLEEIKLENNTFVGIKVTAVSHEEFKVLTKESKAVVRTGECTPYANIILKSGVVF